jgi:hypothetical protein
MGLRETRFAAIQAELDRLGCKEVCLSHVGVDGQVVFVRREEAITCSYAMARHTLLRLPSFGGDEEVWGALKKLGRPGLL